MGVKIVPFKFDESYRIGPDDIKPWDGEFETLPEYAEIEVACAVCGELIQCSTWYRAETCSKRCGATLRKRRQRARRAE